MDQDWPPTQGHHEPQEYERHYRSRGHFSFRVITFILTFAILSTYSLAAMVTQIDGTLFPGNEIGIPIVRSLGGGSLGLDDGQSDQPASIDDRINILLLGLDQRLDDDADQPYRTDSIVVFTIDPNTKTAGAFSIPRDTFVDIPDGDGGVLTTTRINEAYELGEFANLGFGGRVGGGGQLAIDTIEYNFGIPIDHYVIMNWASFIEIIDELGGIDVTIPEYAYDPAYSDCSFCPDVYPVDFEPGVEHMDGPRALAYARIRKSDNDYKRIERQQIVMRAVATKALEVNFLDVGKAKDLYDKYTASVRTNIPAIKIPGLALLGKQVGAENIHMVSMAPATYPCGPACDGAVLLWDPDIVDELKAQVFNDSLLTQERASIEILNGTVVPGMASEFKTFLQGKGIDATLITPDEFADGFLYDNTQVIDVNGTGDYTAEKIAEWLGLPQSSVLDASDLGAEAFLDTTADVVVVLGADTEMPFGAFAAVP